LGTVPIVQKKQKIRVEERHTTQTKNCWVGRYFYTNKLRRLFKRLVVFSCLSMADGSADAGNLIAMKIIAAGARITWAVAGFVDKKHDFA
jgi:hypothetical protein